VADARGGLGGSRKEERPEANAAKNLHLKYTGLGSIKDAMLKRSDAHRTDRSGQTV
jgi:hypothetical protein